MKALIVSEPGENGVFTYVEALCGFLMGRGVSVHLAYSDRRGSDRLDALVERVEAAGGMTVNMGVTGNVGPADALAFIRVWRLASAVRPDIVHCHSSKAGVIGRSLALAGVRASYVYQPHAYFGMRPERRALEFVYQTIEAVYGRIGTTIAVASDERRFATGSLGIPDHRIRFIANGVDMERFAPADARRRAGLREELGVPQGAVVLGAMARLSSQKDPLTLYRAFAAAAARRPGLHLLHVGSGELEAEAGRLACELGLGGRLTRVTYLTDPTKFYGAVDGFILTSTYEGLSLASLEAMASNLPLILSRAPGNVDLLDLPLSHAWSAAPGDAGGFAGCIGLWHEAHVSGSPPNHRAVAVERFDARSAQGAVLQLYQDAVRSGTNAAAAWSARLPALAGLALIAAESTDRFSRANTRRILYPAFHFLTGVSYDAFFGWNAVLRKFGHVLLYGTLAVLLHRALRFQLPLARFRSCAAAALGLTFLAASLDEWHQTFIPSRTGTLADVALDTAAALAALALLRLIAMPVSRTRARRRSPSTPPMRSAPPAAEAAARGPSPRS